MAYHYYQIGVGGALGTGVNVTTSPSAVEPIALRVEDGVSGLSGNKYELLRAIEVLRNYVATNVVPT